MKNELLTASLMEVEELKTTPTEPDIPEEVKEAFIEAARNHAQIKKFNEAHEKTSKKKAQKSNAKSVKATNLKKQNLELDKKYMLFLSSLRIKNASFAMQLQQFSPHFPIIVSAMKQAQNETERNAVFALAENLTQGAQGAQGLENDTQKHYFQTKIAMADPAIFFDFCSKPFLNEDTLKDFFEQTKANIEKKLRCRDHLIEQLSLNVAMKIAGAKDSLSPLLVGPPGTGKSHVAQALAKAMTEAGCPTKVIFHSLAQQSGVQNNESMMMELWGTPSQYSNAKPGKIFDAVSDSSVNYVILVLDEADKGDCRDQLVGLLDPSNPLQDVFASSFDQSIDMRRKLIPILTANDISPLCQGIDDPLWARLSPLDVSAYSAEELRTILVEKLRNDSLLQGSDDEFQAAVDNTLLHLSVDEGIRKLNWAAQQSFVISNFGLSITRLEQTKQKPEKRKIGFGV